MQRGVPKGRRAGVTSLTCGLTEAHEELHGVVVKEGDRGIHDQGDKEGTIGQSAV